jgi:DNA repair protein RadD
MFTLRSYQQAAVDAVYDFLRTKNGNPCIVLPTAAGKSGIMSQICRDAVVRWKGRVLILAHVKELLEQTAATIKRIDPELPVGIYSAGLGSRETDMPIIVAGIQSVYKKACELDAFNLILVDEVHMLPPDGEGMFQTFLKDAKIVNPKVRLIGLTATPYRLKSGTLVGPDNLLNEICYEIGIKELIEQGFLCPLRSKSGRRKVDCSSLHVRGGEFVASEVDELMNTTDNVDAACREIISQTKDRHSVLIFGVSVDHATRIKETIERLTGGECGLVTGDTPAGERERILRRFKGETFATDLFDGKTGTLKYLANVNVLTTGFDAPNIDCVVLLRPTASPGLYYQMTGRGFRLHESKTDCLVLDYGGNILRHGPVDAIQIKEKSGKGTGDAPAKECPKCLLIVHAAVAVCPECGFEFPPPERDTHETTASNEGILTGEVTDTEYDVTEVFYHAHVKRGAAESDPQTMRVDYRVGFNEYKSEWVCPEHSNWARRKFEQWWTQRSNDPPPTSVEHAVKLADAGSLVIPQSIVVRKVGGEKFDRIIKHTLPPHKPPAIRPMESALCQTTGKFCRFPTNSPTTTLHTRNLSLR